MTASVIQTSLQNAREINITVTGRKSGRAISIPVWFVLEGDKLYLLPARGSITEWYKNLIKNPSLQVAARNSHIALKAVPLTEATLVQTVAEKFRQRYGAGQVNSLYSGFDVAVEVPLG